MNRTGARIAYCVGLFLLTACAVIPPPAAPTIIAVPVVAAQSTGDKLASAMHQRIAIEASGAVHDVRLTELASEIAGLRRVAFEDDRKGARIELIDALADELSAAMARRSAISDQFGASHPNTGVANEIIRSLTAAINAEVHGVAA